MVTIGNASKGIPLDTCAVLHEISQCNNESTHTVTIHNVSSELACTCTSIWLNI